MRDTAVQSTHHHHLEQSRAQVIELLQRQAVERELVSRSEGHKADVVAQLVARQQQAALEQRLAQFHPSDIAFVLESLPPEARQAAWVMVKPAQRGAVLLETSEAVRRAVIGDLPLDEIAAAVRPLEAEDIADVLSELDEERRQKVLAQLDGGDQAEVRSLLSFPDGSVGALMSLDFISVRDDTSLEAVHRLLRRREALPPDTDELMVVDRGNQLRGVLPLEKLLIEEGDRLVADVMMREPTFFFTDDAAANAIDAFEKYDLISAPVLSLHRQVVGRVTVAVVLDEIQRRAQNESLQQVGLSASEDLFAPVLLSARNRWPWLGLNLLTAFIASRVIGGFEHIIGQLVALAALMPMVASIGGNTGNQTAALMIRGLALGQLGPAQLQRMFAKELRIASVNGLLWGSVLGVATLALYQDWRLGLTLAAAVLFNLWVAAAGGVLIPLTLQRFGRNPVMGSSVMITALTDSAGFFIFLGLASIFLV